MKILVVPYRDAYFWSVYGAAVRDLQVIEILSRSHDLTVVNRPVSIYERCTTKRSVPKVSAVSERVRFVDSTSFDLIGPLKGRAWTSYCYTSLLNKILAEESYDLILDFSPFSIFYEKSMGAKYWYDLIDNFTKHNRYTERERELVNQKYKHVGAVADLVTGVSQMAIDEVSASQVSVMPNGIYREGGRQSDCLIGGAGYEFDFGFVGFVTDKLDVEFINYLSERWSVVVYGKAFDSSVVSSLAPGVHYRGGFSYSDLPSIMRTFKVGLLPYVAKKCHDESPLKLYEYFKYAKPCLTSINYEIESEFVANYSSLEDEKFDAVVERFFLISGSGSILAEIQEEWSLDWRIRQHLEMLCGP